MLSTHRYTPRVLVPFETGRPSVQIRYSTSSKDLCNISTVCILYTWTHVFCPILDKPRSDKPMSNGTLTLTKKTFVPKLFILLVGLNEFDNSG